MARVGREEPPALRVYSISRPTCAIRCHASRCPTLPYVALPCVAIRCPRLPYVALPYVAIHAVQGRAMRGNGGRVAAAPCALYGTGGFSAHVRFAAQRAPRVRGGRPVRPCKGRALGLPASVLALWPKCLHGVPFAGPQWRCVAHLHISATVRVLVNWAWLQGRTGAATGWLLGMPGGCQLLHKPASPCCPCVGIAATITARGA